MTDDVVIEPDGSEEIREDSDVTEGRIDAKVTKRKKELEQIKKEKQEYLDGW